MTIRERLDSLPYYGTYSRRGVIQSAATRAEVETAARAKLRSDLSRRSQIIQESSK